MDDMDVFFPSRYLLLVSVILKLVFFNHLCAPVIEIKICHVFSLIQRFVITVDFLIMAVKEIQNQIQCLEYDNDVWKRISA